MSSNREENQSIVMEIDPLTFIYNSLISSIEIDLALYDISLYSIWALSIDGTNI